MVLCWCCCPGSAPAQRHSGCVVHPPFDMTPDEPSVVLLSSTSHTWSLLFVPSLFALPSQSRGKWLCLRHVVQARLRAFGRGFIYPSFIQLGGLIRKTPQQWGGYLHTGTCPAAPPPAAGQQVGCPQASPTPMRVPVRPPWYPGALDGRMSACDDVIISMATVCDSTSTGCSTVMLGFPVGMFLLEGTSSVWAPAADDRIRAAAMSLSSIGANPWLVRDCCSARVGQSCAHGWFVRGSVGKRGTPHQVPLPHSEGRSHLGTQQYNSAAA